MRSFALFAALPVLAGGLLAQTQTAQTQTAQTESQTTTTTTTTINPGNTYEGVLVDEGCITKNTERKDTSTNSDRSTTTTTTNTSVTTCPVSPTTSSFALRTSDGKYVRFDNASNMKIVERVKSDDGWKKTIETREPMRVRVIGTPNGQNVVVVEEIRLPDAR